MALAIVAGWMAPAIAATKAMQDAAVNSGFQASKSMYRRTRKDRNSMDSGNRISQAKRRRLARSQQL